MKTDEIMALVVAFAADYSKCTPESYRDHYAVIEAALKEREAPPKAQPMSDAIFLERLLREGSQELVGLTTFVNNSIQGGGRVQLLASAVLIRDFIYRCHGIGE